MKWDADNRLIQIDYPGMNNYSQFSYDGLWRNTKIVETVSGSITSTQQYVWRSSEKGESRDSSGALISKFFACGQTIGASTFLFTLDHLRSVREMTDSLGSIQSQMVYDPYGRVTQLQGTITSDVQYAHYFFHAPSRLNMTRTRAYSSLLGRFFSRDPIVDETNFYVYVGGNPASMVDPSGLRKLHDFERYFIQNWFPGCFSSEDLNNMSVEDNPFGNGGFSPGSGTIFLNQTVFGGSGDAGVFGHEVYHIVQAKQMGLGSFLLNAAGLQVGMALSGTTIVLPHGNGAIDIPTNNPYSYNEALPILPQFKEGNVEQQGQMVQDMITQTMNNGGNIPPKFKDLYDEIKRQCCKDKK